MVDFNRLINKPIKPLKTKADFIKGNEVKEDLLNDLSFAETDFDFAETVIEQPDILPLPKITANLSPKNALIEFLKNAQLDVLYTLQYNGDYSSAEAYIHRMRVELSRFRAKIIKLNKPLDHFHVLTKSITVKSDNFCTIVLLKTYNRKKSNASKEIDDVLSFLTV